MTFLAVARQQIAMQPRSTTMNRQAALLRLRRQRFLQTLVLELMASVLALLVVPAILGATNLLAQTHAPQATKPEQRQPAPEASPSPILPADQPPNRARVSWDSRGLEIEASNSSLDQILHQVAADTGAKLEGLTQDQRVFGNYGPGPGSEVLLKLLDGSGYNVLIIGGRDTDAPLKIVLSARSPASPQTTANHQSRSNSKDDEAGKQLESRLQPDYPPQPPSSQPNQDPFASGEPARDPVQFMQEILQRQQKIDQQQQQDQQK